MSLYYPFLIVATVDIVILAVIGAGAVVGFMKGFVKQLVALLGLIVGLLVAKVLYAPVTEKVFSKVTDSMTAAQVLAFIATWIAAPSASALIASLLTKAVEVVLLGWLSRWSGFGLGALESFLLVSLLIGAIEFIDKGNTPLDQTKKEESVLYYPMKSFAGIFFPAAKHVTKQYILDG